MSKLERKLQKIFAEDSQSTQVTAFRTAGTNPTYTKDVTEIQNANFTKGWLDPNNTGNVVPYAEDMNGLFYTLSRNIAYLNQSGIPEWLSTETYYENAMCMYNGVLYISLADNNLGKQPDTQTSYWRAYASPVSGSVTGGENLGTGEGIYKDAVGGIMQFKGLVAGNNITLTPSVDGTSITIESTGGGGSGSVAWGDITGSLASQVDLSTALSQRGTLSGANTWTGNNTFNKILPVNGNSTLGDTNNLWTIYQSYVVGDETFYFSYEDQRVANSRFLLGLYGGEMGLFPAMSSQDNYKSCLGSSVFRWDNLYTDYANINSAYITTISSVGTIVSPYDYQGNQSRIALSYNPPVLGGSPTQWGWMGYLSSSYIGLFPSTTETGSLGSPNNKWKEANIKNISSTTIAATTISAEKIVSSNNSSIYLEFQDTGASKDWLLYNQGSYIKAYQGKTLELYFEDLSDPTIHDKITINNTSIVPDSNNSYTLGGASNAFHTVNTNRIQPNDANLRINGKTNTDLYVVASTSSGNKAYIGNSSYPWENIYVNNARVTNRVYLHDTNYYFEAAITLADIGMFWKYANTTYGVVGYHGNFMPKANDSLNLGADGYRWKKLYCLSNIIDVSDIRTKDNIEPLEGALDKVNSISIKSFIYKADPDHVHYGFIAQDELDRNPELVYVPENYSENEDGGELGVISGNIPYLALRAIQELSAKVENLENQLRELKQ